MSCSFRQFPAHNFRKETSMEENYSIEGNELHVVRNHKDTVFRMLYNDKEKLLELYNALNGTAYENTDDMEICTLENAIYMGFNSCLIRK